MALSYLLDTSVYSQPIRDTPIEKVMQKWSDRPDNRLCISAIVHAEIIQGLADRNSLKYWRRYRELLENRYVIVPFDADVADTYGRLTAALKKTGKPRPITDLMIAATALRHNLTLATLNIKDFNGIPGLTVENWGI